MPKSSCLIRMIFSTTFARRFSAAFTIGSFNFALVFEKSQPLRSCTAPCVSPPELLLFLFGTARMERALSHRSSFATCDSVWFNSCVMISTSALFSPLFDLTTNAPCIFIFPNSSESISQFTNFIHDCTNCSMESMRFDCILLMESRMSMTSSISDNRSWLLGYSTIGIPPKA